jgi:digalactosyldiacylglycerol synthase
VAVLEEPEHLNWFNSASLWTHHFQHVVGVAPVNFKGPF